MADISRLSLDNRDDALPRALSDVSAVVPEAAPDFDGLADVAQVLA